jgi:hypothetical protein
VGEGEGLEWEVGLLTGGGGRGGGGRYDIEIVYSSATFRHT